MRITALTRALLIAALALPAVDHAADAAAGAAFDKLWAGEPSGAGEFFAALDRLDPGRGNDFARNCSLVYGDGAFEPPDPADDWKAG